MVIFYDCSLPYFLRECGYNWAKLTGDQVLRHCPLSFYPSAFRLPMCDHCFQLRCGWRDAILGPHAFLTWFVPTDECFSKSCEWSMTLSFWERFLRASALVSFISHYLSVTLLSSFVWSSSLESYSASLQIRSEDSGPSTHDGARIKGTFLPIFWHEWPSFRRGLPSVIDYKNNLILLSLLIH